MSTVPSPGVVGVRSARKAGQDAFLPRRVSEALDRLIVGVTTLELAGLKRAPKLVRRPKLAASAARLINYAERKLGLGNPDLPPLRVAWLYAVLVVGLRVASRSFWALGLPSLVPQIRARMEAHAARAREVSGFVLSSPKEDQVVRTSLLLRLLGRHSAGLRLLVRRAQSDLPSSRSWRLLQRWLLEAGEAKAAAALPAREPAEPRPVAAAHEPRRLRYGIVILTMFDTPILQTSIRSLLASDYRGDVVVVEEGNEPAEQCRTFCESVGVRYVKASTWQGCAAGVNQGIRMLAPDTDVVIACHNDVLWPPTWFADLDRAWESVWASDKVSLLNLNYMQINPRVDGMLTDLFLQGEYDDLLWLLRAMRDLPTLCDRVQDVQVKPGEGMFGLARDPWIDWMPDLRRQTGRYSVAASFPMHVWREIGEFDPGIVYAFDLQFLHHALVHRRWALFVATPPVIHLKSSDTEHITPEKIAEIGEKFFKSTYEGFHQKYGWHIEHFLNLYFSESTVVHGDAILRAVNEGRFADVDFVFDDFEQRLATRTLDNCELTWCRVRAQCPYV